MAAMAAAHVSVLSGVDNPLVPVSDGGPPRFGKGDNDTYCICEKPALSDEFMIECMNGAKCNGWIHPTCFPGALGELTPDGAKKLDDSFVCPWCLANEGPVGASQSSDAASEPASSKAKTAAKSGKKSTKKSTSKPKPKPKPSKRKAEAAAGAGEESGEPSARRARSGSSKS